VPSVAHAVQGTKFNHFSTTSGVTKSGALWEGTFYRTATGATVRLTIVHLNTPEGAKNQYADWLKQKAVRIISKEKVQDNSDSTGCPFCKKQFYTMAQFIEHISFDVLPLISEREPGVD